LPAPNRHAAGLPAARGVMRNPDRRDRPVGVSRGVSVGNSR
jgi:hypothetical protein